MAFIKYLNDNTDAVYSASVIPTGELVTITFKDEKKVINTSGFNAYLDQECTVDIGGDSYHGFTTLYKDEEDEKTFILSKDGSVYVEPTPEPTPEETLDDVKARKITELELANAEASSSVDIVLSDGNSYNFPLSLDDKVELLGCQTEVAAGNDKIAWHTSDDTQHCTFYSNADMKIITQVALTFITFHTTYIKDLKIYLNSLDDKESVEAVTYGMTVPEEFRSEVLKALYEQDMFKPANEELQSA